MESRYTRENAIFDAKEDLKKSPEQLLVDIHEESNATGIGRGPLENNIHAQKRFAALITVMTLSNEKVSRNMNRLTWAAVALAAIQILIALISP